MKVQWQVRFRSGEDMRPILDKLRAALKQAVAARDDVLDKIHPNLKSHWKEEFVEGLRLRVSNLESGNYQAELKGDALLDKYGDWLATNKIRIPIPRSR